MALAIASLKKDVFGNKRVHSGQITFDSSYPAGGEALTPETLGLHVVESFYAVGAAGFYFEYDYTNKKLLVKCPGVVTTAAGAGILDDFPLSGVAATAASIGLTAGNATTRFGGMVEVADTVDLSTITCRFIASGY